jgi:hypothetical protein
MISAASFNYYQEVEREVLDIPERLMQQAYETGEPTEVYRVLSEHLMVPWGFFITDQTEL